MTEHTPGPWLDGGKSAGWHIEASNSEVSEIAWLRSYMGIPDDEIKANARLIIAAPDLLAALKELSSLYDGIYVKISDDEMRLCKEVWTRAEAAIAKAEGNSP